MAVGIWEPADVYAYLILAQIEDVARPRTNADAVCVGCGDRLLRGADIDRD